LVEQVPGHAHNVLGLGFSLRQYFDDVVQRLPDLRREITTDDFALRVRPDHATYENGTAFGGDAMGEAFGARPVFRLQDFHVLTSLRRQTLSRCRGQQSSAALRLRLRKFAADEFRGRGAPPALR